MPFHNQTESQQRSRFKRSLYEYIYYSYGYFSFAQPNKVRQEMYIAIAEVFEDLHKERKDDGWDELKKRFENMVYGENGPIPLGE